MNPRTNHVIPLRDGQAPPDGYVELKPYRATEPVYDKGCKGNENARRARQMARGALKPNVQGEPVKA
jgi:hypothetical protein